MTDSIKVTIGRYDDTFLSQAIWAEKNKLALPLTVAANSDIENPTDTLRIDEREIIKATVYVYTFHPKFKVRGWWKDHDYKLETCFLVPVAIHNNGDAPFSYGSMSCSWEDGYRISNDKFAILFKPCEKNIDETITIPPHSVRTQTIIIVFSKDEVNQPEAGKIGLLKYGNLSFTDEEDYLKKTGFIWSNEARLNAN